MTPIHSGKQNLTAALRTLASLIEAKLPSAIEETNRREDSSLRLPQWYRAGLPDNLSGAVNGIAIAGILNPFLPAEGHLAHRCEIAVYSIDQDAGYLQNWDRAEMIQALLASSEKGFTTGNAPLAWGALATSPSGFLPQGWEKYNGIVINYTMTLLPHFNSSGYNKAVVHGA